MLPSVFGERLFDDLFGEPFGMVPYHRHDGLFGKRGRNVMKADVRELEDAYELDVDLPGFKKDDVKVELDDGYLTICASKMVEKEEKGQYIRRERCTGACSRTFFIGAGLEPTDVKAKFEDGILRVCFPKAPGEKAPERKKVEIA